MKTASIALMLLASVASLPATARPGGFIHPMDFDGSDAQKESVLRYIEARVRKDYCEGILDLCQPMNLRMMEKSNLDAFKKAAAATERSVMDRVIEDYCNRLDSCNYTTIWMMYGQNLSASGKKLAW